MLSVLIPVKDWNPCALVESLAAQLIQSKQSFEIIVSDDSVESESLPLSQSIGQLPGVRYFCRQQPLGRSANRNFLADQAIYPFLLFIDGDAGIADQKFIRNYFDHLSPGTVLCGGTLYHPDPPDNPDYLLRWKYGRSREQIDAANRQMNPWKSFSTFNFLIPAEVFLTIRFNETISGYGHEDTFFGIQLNQSDVKIIHLNNGLIHLGLESSINYLEKVRQSVLNLIQLQQRNLLPPKYWRDINLLRTLNLLKKLRITWLISAWFNYRRKSMEKRLCGTHPSLLLLDLYKLGSISHID